MKITIDFDREIYESATQNSVEYFQNYTVTGAEDIIVHALADVYELSGQKFTFVRVKEKCLNNASSETYLEFSNEHLTKEEFFKWLDSKK